MKFEATNGQTNVISNIKIENEIITGPVINECSRCGKESENLKFINILFDNKTYNKSQMIGYFCEECAAPYKTKEICG